MTIRIATYNTENLFRRPKIFGFASGQAREKVLREFNELVDLLDKEVYSEDDKTRITELIKAHRAWDSDPDTRGPIFVNQLKGSGAKLFTRTDTANPDDPRIRIVAKGRTKWAGWAELVRDDLGLESVRNTARVITEIDADIVLTVEVEDRLTLDRFNTQILGGTPGKKPYPFNMLIDGNDTRGIDVGILSRHPITSVRSHLSEKRNGSDDPLFSRDCPEFEIQVNGTPLWILGNHFKSQIGGGGGLRLEQARRVREIYEAALRRSAHVIVAGDLNDSLTSQPIKHLLAAGLQDAMSHDSYRGDPGTHGTGKQDEQKLDYLMFSPALWDKVRKVQVERRGTWAPNTFTPFDTVKSRLTQASDHAALFADLDL
ncbi:endonuclease/exonuclease/phosphatase family protein [Streptomyces tailanensis]|uniref:endonuclease/exonuclease/phosphatase family protein n=1 Tax=Streptomyces tailanensis TaxID=2569858 RepID=UPI00122DFB91|nr:endonuclease/exonuclease/phosphatase family protein [Streptomyces tailanensis]